MLSRTPKIIKIGSFFAELFKYKQGRVSRQCITKNRHIGSHPWRRLLALQELRS